MSVGFHRGVLYWLLLLLPTLAVGTGALWLLRREQARLDEQARVASQSRREAIEARARLIAENVELLVGDVQTGLMATLREAPATNPDAFLENWERENPLVGATFRLSRDDRVLRPVAAGGEVRQWVGAWLAAGAPWRGLLQAAKLESEEDRQVRKDVGANVQQVLNTRNSINELASQGQAMKKSVNAGAVPERDGWVPWHDGNRLHVIGWRQIGGSGQVIGVEVKLAAFAARLGDVLPKEGDFANAFALRETGGAVLQSKTYNSSVEVRLTKREQPAVTVPLAPGALPGWEVVGFVSDIEAGRGAGGGFFLVGALLIGTFIVAILSGGSLLLLQARRSEAEAAQKTSFVANVSHEFKTPLTTIRLYAELLEQGRVRDAAQGGDYLRTIARETQRLARLVNNALDFSRLEQGKKKYAREQVDLAVELTRLLDTHAPRLAEAGLALHRALPATPVPLTTDRDAVEQIVLNLLDNACKYAAEGGEVTVTLVPRGKGGAEVRVADRGPGVPVEHRERIFEKFHRVDDALTAEKSGAGLGLSIARQLARGLGGEVRYASRAGAGAEFILELP
ncbi:MAG TPA: HAMP domain-containing sensor histidine kinase [Opitutaceae bacterium]|nr:HAMP domain-containing sensor histidine kinase [Opitutaceae bacterium]